MKQQKKNNKKSVNENFSKRKGYTLIEVAITVLLFSVVMVIVMSVMVDMIVTKKRIQVTAQNIEDARFAMETMAKNFRESTVFSCNGGTNVDCIGAITSVETFDNFQERCIRYSYLDKKIYLINGEGDSSNCDFSSGASVLMMNENSQIESMNFIIKKTTVGTVGRATISMEICSNFNESGCISGKSDNFPIQTTVSFRN